MEDLTRPTTLETGSSLPAALEGESVAPVAMQEGTTAAAAPREGLTAPTSMADGPEGPSALASGPTAPPVTGDVEGITLRLSAEELSERREALDTMRGMMMQDRELCPRFTAQGAVEAVADWLKQQLSERRSMSGPPVSTPSQRPVYAIRAALTLCGFCNWPEGRARILAHQAEVLLFEVLALTREEKVMVPLLQATNLLYLQARKETQLITFVPQHIAQVCQLLARGSPQVKALAALILQKASHGEAGCDRIIAAGAVPHLLARLVDGPPVDRKVAGAALRNLTERQAGRLALEAAGGIETLIKVIAINALEPLGMLATHMLGDCMRAGVGDPNSIPLLVPQSGALTPLIITLFSEERRAAEAAVVLLELIIHRVGDGEDWVMAGVLEQLLPGVAWEAVGGGDVERRPIAAIRKFFMEREREGPAKLVNAAASSAAPCAQRFLCDAIRMLAKSNRVAKAIRDAGAVTTLTRVVVEGPPVDALDVAELTARYAVMQAIGVLVRKERAPNAMPDALRILLHQDGTSINACDCVPSALEEFVEAGGLILLAHPFRPETLLSWQLCILSYLFAVDSTRPRTIAAGAVDVVLRVAYRADALITLLELAQWDEGLRAMAASPHVLELFPVLEMANTKFEDTAIRVIERLCSRDEFMQTIIEKAVNYSWKDSLATSRSNDPRVVAILKRFLAAETLLAARDRPLPWPPLFRLPAEVGDGKGAGPGSPQGNGSALAQASGGVPEVAHVAEAASDGAAHGEAVAGEEAGAQEGEPDKEAPVACDWFDAEEGPVQEPCKLPEAGEGTIGQPTVDHAQESEMGPMIDSTKVTEPGQGRKRYCYCDSCGLPRSEAGKLLECSRCRSVAYCNVDCQAKHWPKHKEVCKRRAS